MNCAFSSTAIVSGVVGKSCSKAVETEHIDDGFSILHTSVRHFGTVWVASLLIRLEPVKVVEAGGASRSPEEECGLLQVALTAFAQ